MQQTIRRRWRTLAVATLTTLALPATAAAATQDQVDAAIQRGAAWITTKQTATGMLQGFNGNWAATSLAAAGVHAADVRLTPGDPSLQDYTYANYDGSWATLPNPRVAGDLGRKALIASSAGIEVTKISPNINLTASLASKWDAAKGSFGAFAPNSDGFALLAADILHLPRGVVRKIDAQLRAAQKTVDGGWSFSSSPTGAGDIDITGAALSMLCRSGATVTDPAVAAGVGFLHGKLNPDTGGFGTTTVFGIPPSNTPGSSWALIGLKACGVDPQAAEWTTPNGKNPVRFLLDQQRPDGSFKYVPASGATAPQDMNSTESAVRALSQFRWSAPAPERASAADPRMRPTSAVADGTLVPVAVGVDDGAGDVRFCAVQVPSGTPLTAVLEAASTTAIPSGCVRGLQVTGGAVTALNGATTTSYRGWQVQINDGRPQVAEDQRIGFGDVVSLEYGWSTPDVTPVPGPAGPTGPAGDPGAVGEQGPAGAPGAQVTIVQQITKAPAAKKAKQAKVKKAKAKKKAKKVKARCTVQRSKRSRDRVRCSVKRAKGTSRRSKARLTRHGRTYASGTRNRLRQSHQARRFVAGRYTLRIGKGKRVTKILVTLR